MASWILGRASGAGVGNNAVAAAHAAGEGVAETAAQDSGLHIADIFHAMRRFSGFFSYVTGRWSFACFSVVCTVPCLSIYTKCFRLLF